MKIKWTFITALALGAFCAVYTWNPVQAREAESSSQKWETASSLMTENFGGNWLEKMVGAYSTNRAQWKTMRGAFAVAIRTHGPAGSKN